MKTFDIRADWPAMDPDSEYLGDDVIVMANQGDPLARQVLLLIGQGEYRKALREPDNFDFLYDPPYDHLIPADPWQGDVFWNLDRITEYTAGTPERAAFEAGGNIHG